MSCGCNPRTGKDFDPDCEGVSEDDLARFSSDTHSCPDCGSEVFADATICQACGHAIAARPGGSAAKPWVIVATGVTIAAIFFVFVVY